MNLKDTLFGNSLDAMKVKYLGSILRAGLIAVGAVTARDVDDGQITQLAGALIAMASVAWSMYEKRQTRLVTVTALAAAKMTEDDAKALVSSPLVPTPSVNLPTNVVPVPVFKTA